MAAAIATESLASRTSHPADKRPWQATGPQAAASQESEEPIPLPPNAVADPAKRRSKVNSSTSSKFQACPIRPAANRVVLVSS
ncbi:uncharacterized protein LMH87_008020 [Akanthomyces muscarius]|uniref:Uncharacterized protein n=1 Tax=Akanthomyces muscarius TaxID=2231603 RepID=A0A9W8UQH1_AKAMU|nr:uncharacterized protein LMH87_008020 [Akanthomyces muscarius]KAJ4159104.1 hypothetical protein LMH87_008020 [Akanthomyces muscarius]